ncbi:MAG: hypothetical protein RI932_1547 [Pseudomonadota bacterium]
MHELFLIVAASAMPLRGYGAWFIESGSLALRTQKNQDSAYLLIVTLLKNAVVERMYRFERNEISTGNANFWKLRF